MTPYLETGLFAIELFIVTVKVSVPTERVTKMAPWIELIFLVLIVAFALFASRINSKQWLLIDAALAFVFGACTIPFAIKSQEMQVSAVKLFIQQPPVKSSQSFRRCDQS